MKKRNRLNVLFCFLVIIFILIIVSVLWFFGPLHNIIIDDVKETHQRIALLLYKTDHAALLEACRTVAKRVDNGQLDIGHIYEIRESQNKEMLNLPEAILKLNPSYMTITKDGVVLLEMHGGFDHYGVYAFPKDYDYNTCPYNEDMILIKGLWYYDDGFLEVDDYEKELEALRPVK